MQQLTMEHDRLGVNQVLVALAFNGIGSQSPRATHKTNESSSRVDLRPKSLEDWLDEG